MLTNFSILVIVIIRLFLSVGLLIELITFNNSIAYTYISLTKQTYKL